MASVAPAVTSTSVSGSTIETVEARLVAADGLAQLGRSPGPAGTGCDRPGSRRPPRRTTSAGPSVSGKPWPRLIDPVRTASADISAKIVVPKPWRREFRNGIRSLTGANDYRPVRAPRTVAPERFTVGTDRLETARDPISPILEGTLPMSIYDIPINSLDGTPGQLLGAEGQGHARRERRLEVRAHPAVHGPREAPREVRATAASRCSGFPCNQFMGQEPGTPEEIREFCSTELRRHVPAVREDRRQRRPAPPDLRGAHASRPTPRATTATSAGTSRSSSSTATAPSSPGSPRRWTRKLREIVEEIEGAL